MEFSSRCCHTHLFIGKTDSGSIFEPHNPSRNPTHHLVRIGNRQAAADSSWKFHEFPWFARYRGTFGLLVLQSSQLTNSSTSLASDAWMQWCWQWNVLAKRLSSGRHNCWNRLGRQRARIHNHPTQATNNLLAAYDSKTPSLACPVSSFSTIR